MAQRTEYSFRNRLPTMIVRNRANVIEIPVERAGAVISASEGTVTVYRADGTAIVDEQAVTVGGTVTASYSIAAVTLPTTESLGDRWQVSWSLILDDSRTYTFSQEAALVRNTVMCPVAESDITRVVQLAAQLVARGKTLQTPIDDAWEYIQRRLLKTGRRPWLVLSSHDLFEATRARVLAILYWDAFSGVGGEQYRDLATHWDAEVEKEWAQITFTEDRNLDGLPSLEESETAAGGSISVGGAGNRWPGGLTWL